MREAILRRDVPLCDYGVRPRGERWVVTSSACEMYSHQLLPLAHYDPNSFDRGMRVIRLPEPGEECRVLFYNGLGTGYGDLICGSVFVRALYKWIQARGWIPKIRLVPVPSPHLYHRYYEIFSRDPHVDGVSFGGVPLSLFASANLVFSNEALVADGAFDNVDMVEYFFHRNGMTGSKELREPCIYPDLAEFERGVEWACQLGGKRRLFLNFFGSGMRRVSCLLWRDLLDPLLRDGWTVLFSCGPEQAAAVSSFLGKAYASKPVYSTGRHSPTWSTHVGIVAGCHAVLCTDTSTTHVAAALRKPSVTMFQFIDPELRLKHYPKARGWCPDSFRKGKWWGRSHPYPGWEEHKHDEDPEILKPWKKCDLSQPARLLREVAK